MSVPETTPIVRVVEGGPRVAAKQWALFKGLDIAARYIPQEDFQARAALARDIAEELQAQHDLAEAMYRSSAS